MSENKHQGLLDAIDLAFKEGRIWGQTYQGWWRPTQKEHEDKRQACREFVQEQLAAKADPPLERWPTVAEVRSHYLVKGAGFAHALVSGFSDYRPVVVQFYLGAGPTGAWEVIVDFPEGPSMAAVDSLIWYDGMKIQFLCISDRQAPADYTRAQYRICELYEDLAPLQPHLEYLNSVEGWVKSGIRAGRVGPSTVGKYRVPLKTEEEQP